MILLEFDPPKNQSDIWLDINRPQCNTVINPLDLNSANILIDLINKEAECIVRSVWTDSRKSDTNEWIFETDVHEWPQQNNHNFTPVLIEEFVMKTKRQSKQHYTRIALFQIHGTLFYWGRMYEDKDHKEGVWNFKNFQYFKLGFRNDVERFIDQYLKLFSTYSDHPVYCNYIRPHKPPAAITLNQESNGNRPRKRSNRSRKEPYSRVRQPSTPRAPKRQKENKPRAPRVKTGRKRGPYKKSSKDSILIRSAFEQQQQLTVSLQSNSASFKSIEPLSGNNDNLFETLPKREPNSTNENSSIQQTWLSSSPAINSTQSSMQEVNETSLENYQESQSSVEKVAKITPHHFELTPDISPQQEVDVLPTGNLLEESQRIPYLVDECNETYNLCNRKGYAGFRNTYSPDLSSVPKLVPREQPMPYSPEFQNVQSYNFGGGIAPVFSSMQELQRVASLSPDGSFPEHMQLSSFGQSRDFQYPVEKYYDVHEWPHPLEFSSLQKRKFTRSPDLNFPNHGRISSLQPAQDTTYYVERGQPAPSPYHRQLPEQNLEDSYEITSQNSTLLSPVQDRNRGARCLQFSPPSDRSCTTNETWQPRSWYLPPETSSESGTFLSDTTPVQPSQCDNVAQSGPLKNMDNEIDPLSTCDMKQEVEDI